MKEKAENLVKEALAEMFDLLSYKVRNGAMTVEELNSVMSLFSSAIKPKATIKEMASFYGQSEDNVRHIIHRNIMPKPVRKVYYDFESFCRSVPKRWHSKHKESDS